MAKPMLRELLPEALCKNLTSGEERLLAAMPMGEFADLRLNNKQQDDPAQAERWGASRTIRASLLFWLATDPEAVQCLHPKGVQVAGAKITGRLDFEAATLPRRLMLIGCALPEGIVLRDAHVLALYFNDSHIGTIAADRLKTEGALLLRSCRIAGEVCLLGAEIGADLDCSGAKLSNPKNKALSADHLTTKGAVVLREGFEVEGEVRLRGAQIGGNLDCSGAKLRNPDGNALDADRLTTKGAVFLREGFEAEGEVCLRGAQIGGDLDCSGAKLRNPDGNALNANGLTTKGNVFLCQGFEAEGEVCMLGAQIGGNLECSGAKLHNPKDKAFSADHLTAKGSVYLNEGFESVGTVRMLGARIGGDLDCSKAKLRNPKGDALVCERAQVLGALFWRNVISSDGRINLANTRVGQLVDDAASWPPNSRLVLDGFEYGAFAGSALQTVVERLRWLRLQAPNPFVPQPYEQLAKVLRAMGHEQDARAVLIAKQKDRCRFAGLSHAAKVWSGFLGFTICYGYAPWRALWFIAFFLLLGCGVFWCANELGVMWSLKEATWQQPLQPFMYSADVFFPFLDLHQEAHWLPNPNQAPWGFAFRWYLWFHIVMGWIFSTLAVAAFTGLIHKD